MGWQGPREVEQSAGEGRRCAVCGPLRRLVQPAMASLLCVSLEQLSSCPGTAWLSKRTKFAELHCCQAAHSWKS